jgi:hypothetical protein
MRPHSGEEDERQEVAGRHVQPEGPGNENKQAEPPRRQCERPREVKQAPCGQTDRDNELHQMSGKR